MKKRFVSVFLAAFLAISTAACGQQDTGAAQTQQEAVTDGASEESAVTSETPDAAESTSTDEQGKEEAANSVEDGTDIDALLEGMTLRQKVEQMMIVSYRKWDKDPGAGEKAGEDIPTDNVTDLNDVIREDLKEHNYGGLILFGENFVDAEQTLNLISDIQSTNHSGNGLPMLIAVDQEGGSVARVSFGTAGIGNMALAATGDPENARTMSEIYGEELALLGINTDFAPVVDTNNNPNNPVIGVRSFSDSPEVVAEYAVPFMEGLHENGIISTLKHFPGHGDTDTDSHTGFPCINATYEELKECELIPFQKAIEAGADMVMTAHIQYPQIETGTYTSTSTGEQVYIPATMSQTILNDILRKDMGFDGVIVTDALDMEAITDNFAPEDMMLLTMNSGANLILLPAVTNSQGFSYMRELVETAESLAEDGKIDEEKINDSVRRILTLKKKYGLLEQSDFTVTAERISEAEANVGNSESRKVAWDLAEKALTLVKNDDALPLEMEDDDTVLILFADSCASRVGTGDLVKQMLKEQDVINDDSQVAIMVNDKDNADKCVKAAEDADHCILVHRAYSTANLDPNDKEGGFSTAVFDSIIDARHKDGDKTIVVSCQLPYDAARFVDADAMLLSYNSSVMREVPPKSGAGSAYAPNLVAALMACFSDGQITGSLPVNIPKMDKNYKFTDEILYESSN